MDGAHLGFNHSDNDRLVKLSRVWPYLENIFCATTQKNLKCFCNNTSQNINYLEYKFVHF